MEAIVKNNELSFLDLLVAIETSKSRLSLLIAVCDRDRLRISLTERYEKELAPQNIQTYRVAIDRQDPSLFAAMNKLVEVEPNIKAGNHAVITVEGVAGLSSFASEGERSPLDIFLGYLQWTREAMRQFPFPIVIWVNENIHNEISRKAPDFYSWRQGVFFFESEPEMIVPISNGNLIIRTFEPDDNYFNLPIDELLNYIAQFEVEEKQNASLATLYTLLAKAYERDKQIELAIATWQKAIGLQQDLNLSLELTASLNQLGLLYCYQGKYSSAEPLLQKVLMLKNQLLGTNDPDFATSLNNLASVYRAQGEYSKAEPLFIQSLEIYEQKLEANDFKIAISLNNLGELYLDQERYIEAESLFVRSLEIDKHFYGEDHPEVAVDLNNLGQVYQSQGKLSAAETLYLKSLEICERHLKEDDPMIATSLNNLGELYRSLEKYTKAEPLFIRAIAILGGSLGEEHPTTKISHDNLQLLYEQQNALKSI